MNGKVKSIAVIVAAIALVIIFIVADRYSEYKFQVEDAIEYSIYANLNITQQQLINLRDEFNKYGDQPISSEAFYNIIHEPFQDYFFYGDYTYRYKRIDEGYSYLDYSDLSGYLLLLDEPVPEEEVGYHQQNLMKIIKLWAPLTIKASDDYLEPSPKLIKALEEANRLAKEGIERLDEGRQ